MIIGLIGMVVGAWFLFAVIFPAIGSFFCFVGACLTPTPEYVEDKKKGYSGEDYARWDYEIDHMCDRDYRED